MSPIESIICEAMMGTVDRDVALCRVSCNTAASTQMFCKCGDILDQKRTVVVTVQISTQKRKVFANCRKCWNRMKPDVMNAAMSTQTPMLVEGWDGVEFKQGEID